MQTNKIIFSVPLKGKKFLNDIEFFIQHLQILDYWNPDILYLSEQDSKYGKELIQKYGGHWFGYTANTLLNHPRAINIAIKAAKEKSLIFNMMADFRLPKDYIIRICEVWKDYEYKQNYIFGPTIRYEIPFNISYPENITQYSKSKWHLNSGGTKLRYQAISKELAMSLGGYDENFIGWGAPDGDIEQRVVMSKLGRIIPDERLIYAHISHDIRSEWNTKESFNKNLQYSKNLSKRGLIANQNRDWGIWDKEAHNV